MVISSPANPRIKQLALLKERRGRQEQQLFLIEGARELQLALRQPGLVQEVFFGPQLSVGEADLLQQIRQRGIAVVSLSDAPLARLSVRQNPAGLIGVGRTPQPQLLAFQPPHNALVLIAVGLEKPGNLGALLRSADAAGASAVIAVGGVELWHPQVIHNSAGTVFSLKVFSEETEPALAWLSSHQIGLVATSPRARLSLWEAPLGGAVAIALGPEDRGLDPQWLQRAQQQVYIPMQGQADSLNVSVSGAILLYEALRQRTQAL